jgi:tRNA-(ms[2]io[6]A)-hydroxylase
VKTASSRAVVLRVATDPAWAPAAVARFDEVLRDHAHCEKKAAANALSLLQSYPDVPGLPAQMARLAREESAHLARVLAMLEERGLALGRDRGDPYAQGLQALLRNPPLERRLDRLLVAAVIEARSCERLELLAAALPDPALRRFYEELARSEDGHQTLFVRLAEACHPPDAVAARLSALVEAEAALLARLPLRAAIH